MFFDSNSVPHSRRPQDSQATPPQPISGGISPDFWLQSPPMHMPWGLPAGVQPPVFGQPTIMPAPIPTLSHLSSTSLRATGSYGNNITYQFPCKRKMDPDIEMKRPPKLHITEEKMIAQMQDLCIADPPIDTTLEQASESSETSPRLVLSEELKSIQNETNILPTQVLLQRLQPKPTMALMVWQPPNPVFQFNSLKTKDEDTDDDSFERNNNNNNNSSNNNNNDEMNQDTMETT